MNAEFVNLISRDSLTTNLRQREIVFLKVVCQYLFDLRFHERLVGNRLEARVNVTKALPCTAAPLGGILTLWVSVFLTASASSATQITGRGNPMIGAWEVYRRDRGPPRILISYLGPR